MQPYELEVHFKFSQQQVVGGDTNHGSRDDLFTTKIKKPQPHRPRAQGKIGPSVRLKERKTIEHRPRRRAHPQRVPAAALLDARPL